MSDFILDYDILESASKYSRSLGIRSEEYSVKLEKDILQAIRNVTGSSSGYLISASDLVTEKIIDLKQKSTDFNCFAEQINNLIEVAQQVDNEVAEIITMQRDFIVDHHESLRIDEWKAKLINLLVDVKNSKAILTIILAISSSKDIFYKSLKESIKGFYKGKSESYPSMGSGTINGTLSKDAVMALGIASLTVGSGIAKGKALELSDSMIVGKNRNADLKNNIKDSYIIAADKIKVEKIEEEAKKAAKVNETYITKKQLQKIYTNTTVTDEMITELNKMLEKYGITDIENIQHFIAQTCVETGYGKAIVEGGSDSYLNKKKYGKKYSGVGYIQMTWEYSYQAFATYLILEEYPDLKKVASYKNPKNNNADSILKAYNKVTKEAGKKGYSISKYTDIVAKGRDYVASNFAWETAGYYWTTNGLTSADSNTPVDDVTKIVNKWTDSYEARREAYKKVKKNFN